jgi:hypothetical protein
MKRKQLEIGNEQNNNASKKMKHEEGIKKPQSKEEIQNLQNRILSSKKNINDLVEMIQYCKEETECKLIIAYLKSLSTIFTHYWVKKELSCLLDEKDTVLTALIEHREESDAIRKYRKWLLKRYESFHQILIEYLFCSEVAIQKLCVDIIFQMAKFELNCFKVLQDDAKEMLKCNAIVEQNILGKFIYSLVSTSSSVPVALIEHLRKNYLLPFVDVKFFVLHALYFAIRKYKELANSSLNSIGAFCANIIAVVDKLPLPSLAVESEGHASNEELEENYFFKSAIEEEIELKQKAFSTHLKSMNEYKKYFSKFWLAFLLLPDIPRLIYQIVLLRMDEHIIPQFDNPILLTDFISLSFSKGMY